MKRFVWVVCCLVAGPVFAQDSAGDCTVFGQIADRAAEERRNGAEMLDAIYTIAEEYTGAQERFAGAVPLLVDWVYKLEEAQLGANVGATYKTACEAQ